MPRTHLTDDQLYHIVPQDGNSLAALKAKLIDYDTTLDTAPGGSYTIEADPYGPGVNMTAGTINNFTDASLATSNTIIMWKGADNQGTRVTGISSTGMVAGSVRLFLNLSESGTDVGMVVLKHEHTGSLAANRIRCPGSDDYIVPMYGGVILVYGSDNRWHALDAGGWGKRAKIQTLNFYPNMEVTSISGTKNNWNPVGLTTYGGTDGLAGGDLDFKSYSLIRVPVDSGGASLTGLAPDSGTNGSPSALGQVKILINYGPGDLTLKHLNAGSDVINRFNCPQSVDLILKQYESVMLVRPLGDPDPLAQWMVIATAVSNTQMANAVVSGTVQTQSLITAPAQSPSTLASVPTITHDLAPGGAGYLVRVTAHANGSILGGLVSATLTRGERRRIVNVGAGPLVLIDEDASSTAGYRFELPGAKPYVLPSRGSVDIWKDDTDNWKFEGVAEISSISQLLGITPANLAATNIDDWNPTDNTTGMSWQYASWIRTTGAVGTVIRSILPPTGGAGTRKLLTNAGSGYTLKHNDTHMTTGKPLYGPGAADFILLTYASVWLIYDGSVWLMEAHRQGGA